MLALGVPALVVMMGLAFLAGQVLAPSGNDFAFADDGSAENAALGASVGVYVELPEVIANFSTGAEPKFIKVQLVARATDPAGAAVIEARQREILDVVNGYLHALDGGEYYGAAGFERLRAGLRRRAQLALGEDAGVMSDLLIVELVRQ